MDRSDYDKNVQNVFHKRKYHQLTLDTKKEINFTPHEATASIWSI